MKATLLNDIESSATKGKLYGVKDEQVIVTGSNDNIFFVTNEHGQTYSVLKKDIQIHEQRTNKGL
jgi:hypothetical protein